MMTEQKFWRLIDLSRRKARDDLGALVDALQARLEGLPPEEIIEFDAIFDTFRVRAYNRQLWGAAYPLNGGCSDDGFEYFRGWLISRGRRTYAAALLDPDSLSRFAGSDDLELEAILYAPARAYEARTGKELPSGLRVFPELSGEDWTEEGLDQLFPRIARRLAVEE